MIQKQKLEGKDKSACHRTQRQEAVKHTRLRGAQSVQCFLTSDIFLPQCAKEPPSTTFSWTSTL